MKKTISSVPICDTLEGMSNPLLTTLQIMKALDGNPTSADDLCIAHGVSLATLKRHIAEARHLGAVIESRRKGKGWNYVFVNADACRRLMTIWLAREVERSVL
jgi:biotin operon repressor